MFRKKYAVEIFIMIKVLISSTDLFFTKNFRKRYDNNELDKSDNYISLYINIYKYRINILT